MPERQFDQIFIGQANRLIQLQLEHVFLLDFYWIFNGHDLLPLKEGLGQFVHQSRLATADWTCKEIEAPLLVLPTQFVHILKPEM